MYPVSAAYSAAIAGDVRTGKIVGTITRADNTTIDLTDEDILQGSLYYAEQSVSGDDLDVGSVYAAEMGLSLVTPVSDPYGLDGARIALQYGIQTATEPETWEYVPLGIYYVTEIKRTKTTVDIKALDGMLLLDTAISGTLSGTPNSLCATVAAQGGLILATTTEQFAAMPNATLALTVPADDAVKTYRDVLMWVCQVSGAFARINRLGQLEVVQHGAVTTSVRTLSADDRYYTDVSDGQVQITQLSMTVGDATYTRGAAGATMTLETNPLIKGLTGDAINGALDALLASITTVVYPPAAVEIPGDPALQPGDYITLTDTGSLAGTITVPIMHSAWHYRGKHEIKAVGEAALTRRAGQSQENKAVSSVVAIASAAQILATAANQSAQLINQAIGGNILIRQEPAGGHNEMLIMDSADPAQAVKIWRWNMGGLGYSDNCTGADNPDRVYNVAMAMDGSITALFGIVGGWDITDTTIQSNNQEWSVILDSAQRSLLLSYANPDDYTVSDVEVNGKGFSAFIGYSTGGGRRTTVDADGVIVQRTNYFAYDDKVRIGPLGIDYISGVPNTGEYKTNKFWHAGNDGAGSGLDADLLDGQQAAAFAAVDHTHTKGQITDFPASMPANGGNADTVDNKHASDFAAASHSHQKINRDDGQGWGVGPTGYLAPMQYGNYIANGSLGSSSYTLATMWSIFWRRNNIGVGLHPDGALAPCDAEGWAATQMDLGTSKWRYGTLYLTDTVQADRLKTADATSASNAIIDANGTIRRTSGSSRRFKRDIADLPDAEADAVLGLRPVRFEFKLDPPGVERNGFIAEEVLEVAPQFVDRTTLEDGTVQCDNVRYSEITAALVSIVKRQQARIAALEARITALEQA